MKFGTACQHHEAGENAVKCLSQGHNRIARVGFEPRPWRLQLRSMLDYDLFRSLYTWTR